MGVGWGGGGGQFQHETNMKKKLKHLHEAWRINFNTVEYMYVENT